MKLYKRLRTLIYMVCKKICYVPMAAMMFVTIMTIIDIVLRLLSNVAPDIVRVKGTYEVTQLCMTLIVFLAYAITEWEGGHVGVTILTSRLPAIGRRICLIIVNVIMTAFAFLFFYCSLLQTQTYLDDQITTSILFIPYWPFAICMTAGILIFGITFVFKTIDSIAGLSGVPNNAEVDTEKV